MNLIKEFITLDAYSFALSHPATLNPITIYYYFQSRHVSKRESRGGVHSPTDFGRSEGAVGSGGAPPCFTTPPPYFKTSHACRGF